MPVRRKKRRAALWLLPVLLLLLGAAAFFALRPRGDAVSALRRTLETLSRREPSARTGIDAELEDAFYDCLQYRVDEPFTQKLRSASGSVTKTTLDPKRLTDGLGGEMQALLTQKAEAASRRAELYAPDGTVLPELRETLYASTLDARLSHAADYCSSEKIPVSMRYSGGEWAIEDASLLGFTVPSRPGYETATEALQPVALHYTLPPDGPGPVPNPACYGETEDAREIAALLQSDTAQRLINGQKLDFDPNRDMLGRPIYYYLDETILVLVWQQDEHGAVGTFAEVFIADASQLRRKLADDSFGSYQYYYPSEFAAQTNAVLACSGDFYNSGRPDYGLYVYEGTLQRYYLAAGQSCLFNGEGDMLMVYENQFSSPEEAQRFIDENGVNFSLSFGPVMIDHGVDVTPYDYPFGEVLDTYARCAIGQLGKLHYLMMTINCESPDHYVYVTLRQAADSMVAHGCLNAYTLDGGQTGSILIGGRLINPVQFGAERTMSDIFYFATALPSGE